MKIPVPTALWHRAGIPGAVIASILGISLVILSLSCSGKEKTFEPFPYGAVPELINSPVTVPELSLQFSPPKGWAALDSTRLDAFRKLLGNTELQFKFYHVYILNAYMDSLTGCLAYIARIEEEYTPFPGVVKRYHEFLAPRAGVKALDEKLYLINDLIVYHFMVHSVTTVNYKLLGEVAPTKRYLIEYILSAESAVSVEPAVQASIASLKHAADK
jgi:hypothetical protein